MLSNQEFYKIELKKMIQAEVDRLIEILVTGHNTLEFPQYKHHVGKILGLRDALELCEEAQTEIARKNGY